MKRLIILAASCMAPGLLWASPAADIIAGFSQGLSSYQASFRQQLLAADGEVLDESSGVVSMELPSRFRWHYAEPFEQIIVADGDNLWVYDVDLDQVSVRGQESVPNALGFLIEPERLGDAYDLSVESSPDGRQQVHVQPRDAGHDFRLVTFEIADQVLLSARVVDALSQVTEFQFEGPLRNPELDSALFVFEPPAGVDVIGGYEPE